MFPQPAVTLPGHV